MAKCSYCGSGIIMGGMWSNGQRFCSKKCLQSAYILNSTKNVPNDLQERTVQEVWRGNCPKCRQPGPVDVHKFYEVWSILVLTRSATSSRLSCRSCGVKRQLGALTFSLFCGWWGIPWGLIMTPVQITRNVLGMVRGPDSAFPSADLRKLVLVNLGTRMAANQKAAANKPPPIPK